MPIKKAKRVHDRFTSQVQKASDSAAALGACTCGEGMVPIYSTLDEAKKGVTPSGVVATGQSYDEGKTERGGGFLSSFRSVVFSAETKQVTLCRLCSFLWA